MSSWGVVDFGAAELHRRARLPRAGMLSRRIAASGVRADRREPAGGGRLDRFLNIGWDAAPGQPVDRQGVAPHPGPSAKGTRVSPAEGHRWVTLPSVSTSARSAAATRRSLIRA